MVSLLLLEVEMGTPVVDAVVAQWPDHMWGWGAGWMWVVMAVLWVLAITLVIYAIASRSRDKPPRRSARDVLAERFAAGEIDADEYRARLEVLEAEAGHRRTT